MNELELTALIKQKILSAQKELIDYEEFYRCYNKPEHKHEFLFFIKPEITLPSEKIKLDEILSCIFEKIHSFDFYIDNIRLLSASYIKEYDIIAHHYGVINHLSLNAKEHILPEAAEHFESVYAKRINEVKLIGGNEYLQAHPDYTADSLDRLWQNSVSVKLAPGTYCAEIKNEYGKIYLINGFHPKQLNHFTEKGRSIVAFTLSSDIDWKNARNDFIGKTNPADAKEGSLRHELYENTSKYGLDIVSSSQNGCHLSAGPVEGLVELIRYNSDRLRGDLKKAEDFRFGRKLLTIFDDIRINAILDNHLVNHNGHKLSVYDLTEEKNEDEALQLLKEVEFY